MESRHVYRDWTTGKGLVSYAVTVGSTDLQVSTDRELRRAALESTSRHRGTVERYIRSHPRFATSLEPVAARDGSPELIQQMAAAARVAGVGPMAAVAGAIAQAVGADLLRLSPEVIVENGGDVFMSSSTPRTVGLYAGHSTLNGRIGLSILPSDCALGICTSSGTFGHSLSLGAADACTVLARSAAVADALATALCNRIRTAGDLERVLDPELVPPEAIGVLAVIGGKVAFQGNVRLVPLRPTVVSP